MAYQCCHCQNRFSFLARLSRGDVVFNARSLRNCQNEVFFCSMFCFTTHLEKDFDETTVQTYYLPELLCDNIDCGKTIQIADCIIAKSRLLRNTTKYFFCSQDCLKDADEFDEVS